MKQNIKEKVLKDMFPNKTFIFLRKDGVNYISDDIVDILSKHKKDQTLAEVGKVMKEEFSKFKTPTYNFKHLNKLEEKIKQKLGIK